jgi:thioredoxin 1
MSIEEELFMLPTSGKAIVDCYADWCGPCKAIAPYFEELKEQNKHIIFLKCNIDDHQEFAKKYNISSIPSFIAFVNGQESDRLIGANKTKLSDMVNKLSNEN